jgi:hypothetical protein
VWRKRGTSCTNWRTEIPACVSILAVLVTLPVEALVIGRKADEVCDVEDVPRYIDRTCEIEVRFKVE